MAQRLTERVALITGAARGIGLATAKLLCDEGATVFLGDVIDDLGALETAELAAQGGRATYLHLDVTEPSQWAQAMARIKTEAGRLDILVNNAAVTGDIGNIGEVDLNDWRRVTAVNYDGVFLGMRAALPLIRSTGLGGSIINIASTAGLAPVEWLPSYSATKAAVISLTRAIALQCGSAGDGVRVNAIAPGLVETAAVTPERAGEIARRIDRVVPLKRQGQPDDVAQGVLWLVSDESKYVTGGCLVIDGGLSTRFPLIPPDSYVPA